MPTTVVEDLVESCFAIAAEEVDYDPVATEKQIKDIHRRLGKLKNKTPTDTPTTSAPERPKENWLKRNAYWLPIATLVLGSGIGTGLLTSLKDSIIDNRIRETLHDPLQKIIDHSDKIAEIDGKLSSISEMLKFVVQNETKRTAALPLPEFQKGLSTVSGLLTVAKNEGSLAIGAAD